MKAERRRDNFAYLPWFHVQHGALDFGEHVALFKRSKISAIFGSAALAVGYGLAAFRIAGGLVWVAFLFAANVAAWPLIEASVAEGQQTFKALKYAKFPTVAATSGLALGGGCEIQLHCSATQAHAESYIGLVDPRWIPREVPISYYFTVQTASGETMTSDLYQLTVVRDIS